MSFFFPFFNMHELTYSACHKANNSCKVTEASQLAGSLLEFDVDENLIKHREPFAT